MNMGIRTRILLAALVILMLLSGCTNTASNVSTQEDDTDIRFDENHLLPLGSVVLLKEGSKKIMICGRAQKMANDESNTIYDYSACYYPEGIINPNELFLFSNEDIEKVFFKGFSDDEELEFRELLEEKMKEITGE